MAERDGALRAPETTEDPPSAPASREQLRSRRKRAVRARTVSVKRMTKRELEIGRRLYPEEEHDGSERPRTRAGCADVERPCPFVSCEHHLYLDVSARTGAIKLNFPDLEVEELTESCALDIAGRGGTTLEDVGTIMNLTRERVRQIEVKALAKALAATETREFRGLVDYANPSPNDRHKRRLPVLHQERESEDEDEARGDADFDVDRFASDALDTE